VNRVVPAAELMTAARAMAAELASKPPLAVRYAMEAVHRGVDMSFNEACQLEAALFGLVMATEDKREGTAAFLEKRKPEFKGR
jgi:enoyl-CoA hydratase